MGTGKGSRKREPSNLYTRDGVWYARVTVGGVEHRRSLKTGNRREAERRLKDWLAERSPYHGTVRHTFKEAATLWMEAGEWKPKTAASYAKLLNTLLAHLGDLYWDQVDKAELQRLIEKLRQPKGANRKGAGTATVNRYLTVVSGIADHVKELPGWPEINPVSLLPKKPRRERRRRYVRPPAADVEAFFARMKGTFGDLARVALLSGIRMDELAQLHRANAMSGAARLYDTKNHTPRMVPWTDEARAIVERQPEHERSPYLFNTRHGGHYRRVTEMWREVVIRAQSMAQKQGRRLTPMRFHDLRHEYAIRYLEAGGSIYRLQKLMGHSTIGQTEEYLDYLTPEQAEIAKSGSAQ